MAPAQSTPRSRRLGRDPPAPADRARRMRPSRGGGHAPADALARPGGRRARCAAGRHRRAVVRRPAATADRPPVVARPARDLLGADIADRPSHLARDHHARRGRATLGAVRRCGVALRDGPIRGEPAAVEDGPDGRATSLADPDPRSLMCSRDATARTTRRAAGRGMRPGHARPGMAGRVTRVGSAWLDTATVRCGMPARVPRPRHVPRRVLRTPARARRELAERVGFEPTEVALSGFQDRRIQPLCHLSAGRKWGTVGRDDRPSLNRLANPFTVQVLSESGSGHSSSSRGARGGRPRPCDRARVDLDAQSTTGPGRPFHHACRRPGGATRRIRRACQLAGREVRVGR